MATRMNSVNPSRVWPSGRVKADSHRELRQLMPLARLELFGLPSRAPRRRPGGRPRSTARTDSYCERIAGGGLSAAIREAAHNHPPPRCRSEPKKGTV